MMPGTQTVEGLLFLASLARALDARELFEIATYQRPDDVAPGREPPGGDRAHP